jgi:uncharacterized membrane protein YcjF (UPF0283 family)
MRSRKPGAQALGRLDPEQLSTEQVVELHERLYAPLDAAARSRIVDAAHRRGWDRPWDMDGLAA